MSLNPVRLKCPSREEDVDYSGIAVFREEDHCVLVICNLICVMA